MTGPHACSELQRVGDDDRLVCSRRALESAFSVKSAKERIGSPATVATSTCGRKTLKNQRNIGVLQRKLVWGAPSTRNRNPDYRCGSVQSILPNGVELSGPKIWRPAAFPGNILP